MRPATQTEIAIFMAVVCKFNKMTEDELASFQAFVLDQYITDTPGYAGPVGLIIWGGGPAWVTVFTKHHQSRMWEIAVDTCFLTECVIPRLQNKLASIKGILNAD